MSEPEAAEASSAPSDIFRPALGAAVNAFVAARNARVLLDTPGRLGANAVARTRPISGARRASGKAQAKMEQAAHELEQARDRWGALMRGLADDLDLGSEELIQMTESAAIEISIQNALSALEAGLAAAHVRPDPKALALLQEALTLLRRTR